MIAQIASTHLDANRLFCHCVSVSSGSTHLTLAVHLFASTAISPWITGLPRKVARWESLSNNLLTKHNQRNAEDIAIDYILTKRTTPQPRSMALSHRLWEHKCLNGSTSVHPQVSYGCSLPTRTARMQSSKYLETLGMSTDNSTSLSVCGQACPSNSCR